MNAANIVRGEDYTLSIWVSDSDGVAYSLGVPDEIEAKFYNSDGTVLTKKLTEGEIVIVSDPRGEVNILLSDTDTSELKVGTFQDFDVHIVNGDNNRIVKFKNLINVVEKVR